MFGIKRTSYLRLNFYRDAHCAMVTIEENRHATRVQTLDEAVCISHSANTFGKSINPLILPSAMGK